MELSNISKVLKGLINWRDFRLKLFAQGILVGIFAGTLVVFFRFILEKAEFFLQRLYTVLRSGNPLHLLIWGLVLLVIAYFLGIIRERVPQTAGSGIPQVKGVVSGHMNMDWLKIIVWKIAGGALAIGAGLSLGREGPSIQLGAAAGQGINRLLGGLKIEERILITSGAGAGLAAAFSAPLAGVIFALEELHKNFSPPVLMSVMAASLTADFISQHFFGIKPIFDFHVLPVLPFKYYFYLIILGIVVGVFGVVFNWALLKTQDIYKKQKVIPPGFHAVFPLLVSILVGLYLPACLSGGNNLINTLSSGHFSIFMLVILVIVKFLFTVVSYGSGAPGGIFLPLLVIGALSGSIFGNVVVNWAGVSPDYVNNFIVFAMAGYFTAIVKAPITGSILITEMTYSFSHLLPVIIVSIAAYVASDILNGKPVYDQLLQRMLANKSEFINREDLQKKTLLEIAVCLGSVCDHQQVKDLKWPANCLLVGVRRGEAEIIPHGETIILAGDYLNILTNEAQAANHRKILQSMTENTAKTGPTEKSQRYKEYR
ncbi:MAG: ClC family H(+)/Cl(-) exchange transporter [Syntrophomonas sp.]